MENIFYDKVYGEYTIGFQIKGDDTGIHETQHIYFKHPRFQSMNGTQIESSPELGPFIRISPINNSTGDNCLNDKISAFIDGYCDSFIFKDNIFEDGTEPVYILREDMKEIVRKETVQNILNQRANLNYKAKTASSQSLINIILLWYKNIS